MAERATEGSGKKMRRNSQKVGCFGRICRRRNKIIQVKPAVKSDQSDDETSPTFKIQKNNAPVSTVHSALKDQPTSNPATNSLTEPATTGGPIKMLANANNNNDDDEKAGRSNGYSKEAKERAVGERGPASDSTGRQPTPATDVLYNGLIVATGDASGYPGACGVGQAGGRPHNLPHLTNAPGVFHRRRRDQEEILHELQREGIVADPRVTIGGVAYEIPVARRADHHQSFHLESDVIGLLRHEKEKDKRRLLELKIKMCRAQERRDLAELAKLERILENQEKLHQVRDKMEYDEDLKVRRTNINIIKKLTKGATNRETRDREKRWKIETRKRHREKIRMARKMKGIGMHRKHNQGSPEDEKDDWDRY